MSVPIVINLGNIPRSRAEEVRNALCAAGQKTWVGTAESWSKRINDPTYESFVSTLKYAVIVDRRAERNNIPPRFIPLSKRTRRVPPLAFAGIPLVMNPTFDTPGGPVIRVHDDA